MRTANSVDVSDRQPIFLKDKGDGLYAQGNFHAAINAYNIAIERDEEDSQLSILCRFVPILSMLVGLFPGPRTVDVLSDRCPGDTRRR